MSTMVLALLLGLAACGPLQVGVEPAPASAEVSPTATPSATPEDQSAPGNSTPISAGPDAAAGTVVALQTANARLAGQVATLTAAQALLIVPTEAIQATATPSSLPTLAPSATPAATPAPALPPTRITFQRGSASATVSPDLAGGSRAYVLKVLAGQHLILSADRDLDVRVTGPDGRTLTPIALRPQQWEYTIGQTGDQTMTLTGTTRATVTIYVPPR